MECSQISANYSLNIRDKYSNIRIIFAFEKLTNMNTNSNIRSLVFEYSNNSNIRLHTDSHPPRNKNYTSKEIDFVLHNQVESN